MGGASWLHATGAAKTVTRPIIPNERANVVRNIASSSLMNVRYISGLMQCSSWDRYSITSSASAKKFTGNSMPVRRDRITGSNIDHSRHIRDLASERGWKAAGDDHIDSISLHAAHNLAKLAHLTARAARLERKIFAECVAVLLQLLQQERPERRLLVYRRTREQRADTIDLRWGLCDRAGASNQRADEKGNEVAT